MDDGSDDELSGRKLAAAVAAAVLDIQDTPSSGQSFGLSSSQSSSLSPDLLEIIAGSGAESEASTVPSTTLSTVPSSNGRSERNLRMLYSMDFENYHAGDQETQDKLFNFLSSPPEGYFVIIKPQNGSEKYEPIVLFKKDTRGITNQFEDRIKEAESERQGVQYASVCESPNSYTIIEKTTNAVIYDFLTALSSEGYEQVCLKKLPMPGSEGRFFELATSKTKEEVFSEYKRRISTGEQTVIQWQKETEAFQPRSNNPRQNYVLQRSRFMLNHLLGRLIHEKKQNYDALQERMDLEEDAAKAKLVKDIGALKEEIDYLDTQKDMIVKFHNDSLYLVKNISEKGSDKYSEIVDAFDKRADLVVELKDKFIRDLKSNQIAGPKMLPGPEWFVGYSLALTTAMYMVDKVVHANLGVYTDLTYIGEFSNLISNNGGAPENLMQRIDKALPREYVSMITKEP
ncbi:hypothetical protein ACFL0W_04105 [Nanoarchaeota archaeon]